MKTLKYSVQHSALRKLISYKPQFSQGVDFLEIENVSLSENNGLFELAFIPSKITTILDVQQNKLRVNNHDEKKTWLINLSESRRINTQEKSVAQQPALLHTSVGLFQIHNLTLQTQIASYKHSGLEYLIESANPNQLGLSNSYSVLARSMLELQGLAFEGLPSGVILNITVKSKSGVISSVRLIELVEKQEVPKFTLDAPAGYRDITPVKTKHTLAKHRIQTKKKKQNAVAELDLSRLRHRLRAFGQDIALILNQDFLDTLRNAINVLSTTIGSLTTDDRNNIEIDWFQNLMNLRATRLNQSLVNGPVTADELERGLKYLALHVTVMAGANLPIDASSPEGFDAALIRNYESILAAADAASRLPRALPVFLERIRLFQNEFPTPGPGRFETVTRARFRDGLADRIWEKFETKPFVTQLPFESDSDDVVDLHLSSMSYSINIDKQQIISSLEFRDGLIRAQVDIKEIDIDFDFVMQSKEDVVSVVLGIVTFGVYTALVTNSGVGTANLNDIHLVVEFVPILKDGEFTYDLFINPDESTLDANIWTIGINPFSDLAVSVLVSPFMNLFDAFAGSLVNGISDETDETDDTIPIAWPSLWSLENGSALTPTTVILNTGTGVHEADTIDTALPGMRIRAEIDPQLPNRIVPNSSWVDVFSPRYINLWLNNALIPAPWVSTESGSLFSRNLGIRLQLPIEVPRSNGDPLIPPIIDIPIGVGCGEPPATSAPRRSIVLSTNRFQPTVELPAPTGAPNTNALAIGSFRYDFKIEAVKDEDYYDSIVIREPCFDIDLGSDRPINPRERVGIPIPDAPGGLPGFPELPDRPSVPSHICPPPRCEWVPKHRRIIQKEYLSATLTAQVDIVSGFAFESQNFNFILPTKQFRVRGDGTGLVLNIRVDRLELVPELEPARTQIETDFINRVRQDVIDRTRDIEINPALFASPLFNGFNAQDIYRLFIQPQPFFQLDVGAGVNEAFRNLVNFEMIGQGFVHDEDLAFWPVRLQLNLNPT